MGPVLVAEWQQLIAWAAAGVLLVAVAFALRVAVHAGRTPSGVDTWYYLAYAEALRRRPRLDARLPQYLLQDEKQSYAPLFPTFLALLPPGLLRRWFWAVSPAVDCVHLLLLYWLAFKITDSVVAAVLAAGIYAFTPQLISETRSLNGRSFGALLHSIAMVLLLRYTLSPSGDVWPWLPLALLAGAAVYLSSATSSAAYGWVSLSLSVVFGDPRPLLVALGAMLVATVLSLGHFLNVVRNYFQAIAFWQRNRGRYGLHPVRGSPIYDGAKSAAPARPVQHQGFLGQSTLRQLVRLLAENPFLAALPLVTLSAAPWGPRLYWWAVALAVLAVAATLFPPLRAFGPGRSYMKAAIFPTGYTLAVGIGSVSGALTPVGVATLLCLLASLGAIGFFYVYTRRRATEHTATAPDGLVRAVAHLATLPGDGVLVLPYMYADFTMYNARKSVLWGGHCGDLTRLEAVAPVLQQSVPDLLRQYGARYVLVDVAYVQPEELRLGPTARSLGRWDGFCLFDLPPVRGDSTQASPRSHQVATNGLAAVPPPGPQRGPAPAVVQSASDPPNHGPSASAVPTPSPGSEG